MLNINERDKSPEPVSDMSVKRDVEQVGILENGLKLYRFKYLWSDKEFVGVMAQDVMKVRPEAVFTTRSGLLSVDYDMIGTEFMTYEDWLAQNAPAAKHKIRSI